MLTYKRSRDVIVKGYSNFDFASYLNDHMFTFRYVFMMVKGVVLWTSNKPSITTTSTMEVKYIMCYKAMQEIMWLRNFIIGLISYYYIYISSSHLVSLLAPISLSRSNLSLQIKRSKIG